MEDVVSATTEETVVDDSAEIRLGERVSKLRSAEEGATGRLIRGSALFVGSLLLWAWTFLRAVAAGGGVYIIAFGAGAYGAGGAVNAFVHRRNARRALMALERQYGAERINAAVAAWADELLGGTDASAPADQVAASMGPTRVVGSDKTAGYMLIALAVAALIGALGIGYGVVRLVAGGASPDPTYVLASLGMLVMAGVIAYMGIRLVRRAAQTRAA